MRPHPVQARLFESDSRFQICTSGRRSGKTEVIRRRVVYRTWRDRFDRCEDGRLRLLAAPTRDQAKFIFWLHLLKLLPKAWIAGQPNYTELSVVTKWDTQIRVVGLDQPQRIEGTGLDEIDIDEFASCKAGMVDAHIFPMLMDRHGILVRFGVPDQEGPCQVEYEQLLMTAGSGKDKELEHFHWPSADIQPAEEVEAARQRMDPLIFRQEMLGEFVSSLGKFAPDFDYKIHVRDNVWYNPNEPLCWSLDFNIGLQCSLVCQHDKGRVRVLAELCVANVKTEIVCSAFIELCRKNLWNIKGVHIYGDCSGVAKDSTSGISDWFIVQNMLKNAEYQYHVSPRWIPIADTKNAVNGRLKNAAGVVNIEIDSSCGRLIGDLRSALWPSDLEEQHCLAGLRYFCHAEYPVTPEGSGVSGKAGTSNARD